MRNRAVQAAILAVVTAIAIAVARDDGPVPYFRFLMILAGAGLTSGLAYAWMGTAESAASGAAEEARQEAARLKRELQTTKTATDEFKEKAMKVTGMLTHLGAIAKMLGQSLDLAKLMQSIADTVGSLGATRASLWLLQEDQTKLKLAGSVGWPDAEKATEVTVGEGIVGHVVKSGSAADPTAVLRDPALLDHKKKSKFPTVMCFPLVNNQEVLGAINIETMDAKKMKSGDLGEEIRMVGFLATLAAMSIKNAKVFGHTKELAERDGMTKLYTHRYYQDTMDRELKRAERYGDRLSILLTDIDKFKSFNDTYGHQVGDEVLKETARIMKDLARDIDIPCRYGGEEFVLILPQTDKRGAQVVAERLRKAIETNVYKTSKGDLRVTMSIGVGTYPEDARDKTNLVKLCDEALYRAKEGGRNRVELADVNAPPKKPKKEAAAAPPPAAEGAAPPSAAPGQPQAFRPLTEEEQLRLAQAHAAAIQKARALAQQGDAAGAREAEALANRIGMQRTRAMVAVAVDPNLAAKARAAAKLAASRTQPAAGEDPNARAQAARRSTTMARPVNPGGGGDGTPEGGS